MGKLKVGHPIRNREKPAVDVALAFGGTRLLSDLIGVDASTVSRWCTSAERGGTGGRIPQRHWPGILKAAQARGLTGVDVHLLAGIDNE